MYKKVFISATVLVLILIVVFIVKINANSQQKELNLWKFQSIDTMKYSRDVSREKLNDPLFDTVINQQIADIASTGATHVAIATPYDEEFYPILKRWVDAARRNNLNVWFRGNWSGWEEWFDYASINRDQHIEKTQKFIFNHPDLFADGDVFTACPECENGGPGDPRHNGDVEGHRQFLIDEYAVTKAAFKQINKDVSSNFNSMNGDVARLVMDKETTTAMDGIVAIDHYVSTPEKLISDIKSLSISSGGKIVLGEFGAPIPDIHGKMTEEEQSAWIEDSLDKLADTPEVVGVNYWTNTGSSTELWKSDGSTKEAVSTLTSFYKLPVIKITVKDELGNIIKEAKLSTYEKEYSPDKNGEFHIPYLKKLNTVEISAPGYFSQNLPLNTDEAKIIILKKENESIIYKLQKLLTQVF